MTGIGFIFLFLAMIANGGSGALTVIFLLAFVGCLIGGSRG
jgi:hypothetical protein